MVKPNSKPEPQNRRFPLVDKVKLDSKANYVTRIILETVWINMAACIYDRVNSPFSASAPSSPNSNILIKLCSIFSRVS